MRKKQYEVAKELCREKGDVSASFLQQRLAISYSDATCIVAEMVKEGFCTYHGHSKPLEIIEESYQG